MFFLVLLISAGFITDRTLKNLVLFFNASDAPMRLLQFKATVLFKTYFLVTGSNFVFIYFFSSA